MLPIDFARMRVRAFLSEVARLGEAEFPYPHSKHALETLKDLFEEKSRKLDSFDIHNDPSTVKRECEITLRDLFRYTRVLGFVLRSTNIRNSFEAYRPLLRLARSVLEHATPKANRNTRLLLSSEWDYSPFVYPEQPALRGFVLIGLPAHESGNPFLFPLAGHELGHSLWAKKQYSFKLQSRLNQHVVGYIKDRWTLFKKTFPQVTITQDELDTNLFAVDTWKTASLIALRQVEESFCDIVGIRIFGEAYLNAFAYLMSPNISGPRSTYYPNMKDRINNMLAAADSYGMSPRADYANFFEDNTNISSKEGDEFLLKAADAARQAMIKSLINQADKLITDAGVDKPTPLEIDRIHRRLRLAVPAEHCLKLADIINAGWTALEDQTLWEDAPNIKTNKESILKELVLKSIEVFEIEQILEETSLC